jgi:hypothetical protein
MQLDAFITESIKSIIKGVKGAQPYAKEQGGRVNPIRMQNRDDLRPDFNVFFGNEENARPLTIIEFDVAVTISSQQDSKLEGGIAVVNLFKTAAGATATDINQSVSRIKFLIGASLPHELT